MVVIDHHNILNIKKINDSLVFNLELCFGVEDIMPI